jgi:hypothetical protein
MKDLQAGFLRLRRGEKQAIPSRLSGWWKNAARKTARR